MGARIYSLGRIAIISYTLLQAAACASTSHEINASPAAVVQPPRDAAELRSRCIRMPIASRMGCYDTGLLSVMRAQGVNVAMDFLDKLTAIDADVKREEHMYAHSMGLAAFTTPEQMNATFRQCSPAFQSGCYHGVIQAYFSHIAGSGGIDAVSADAINNLCRDYRGKDDMWLLFQCVHGEGHGLSQVAGHDIKQTLGGCDKLQSAWEREGCYGGVFMENQMEAFAPHHSVGRPTTPGGASMDMTGMAGMDHNHETDHPKPSMKLIDPADPLYPCSILEARYLDSCYLAQTSTMLSLNHGDFADAARTCDRLGIDLRALCYVSLGRDVSSYTQQNLKRAATTCSTSGDPEFQPYCHTGFVKNLIDISADFHVGLPYCSSLTRAADKTACYRAVGEEISVLFASGDARLSSCATVESEYRETCAVAAGVRRQIP